MFVAGDENTGHSESSEYFGSTDKSIYSHVCQTTDSQYNHTKYNFTAGFKLTIFGRIGYFDGNIFGKERISR